MSDPTRRTALAVAPSLLLGAAAADEPKKKPTDREIIASVGLTEAEAECWELAGKLAGAFFALPKMHPMDEHEVAHAIHVVQNKLLGRPTYRKYLEAAKKAHGG